MNDIKFCKDCDSRWSSICYHESLGRDLVTGHPIGRACYVMRDAAEPCGPDAKLFTPRREGHPGDRIAEVCRRPASTAITKLDAPLSTVTAPPKPPEPKPNLFTILGNLFK